MEKDRISLNSLDQNQLYCPLASFDCEEMPTRGYYSGIYKGYPLGAVIHYSAGNSFNGDADANNIISYGAKLGYCYIVISSTGTIFQTMPLNKWGYHCGVSSHPSLGTYLSNKLIGIELCNAGKLTKLKSGRYMTWWGQIIDENLVRTHDIDEDNIKEGHYHKFTTKQEISLTGFLLWLKRNNSIFNLDYVLGHDEVSPDRKTDPGGSLSVPMTDYRSYLKKQWELMIG